MYAWPGITRAANGDIIVSASERKFHCGPNGREVIIRSTDDGETWELPQEVYNSELDDRDANILACKDGSLILSWFTSNAFEKIGWMNRSKRVTQQMRDELLGTWMLKSEDNGKNWGPEILKLPAGMHIAPVELTDGSLLSIGIEKRFKVNKNKKLSCFKSDNMGRSWYKTHEFKVPTQNFLPILNENHVLETIPGKLVALFRKNGDFLFQAVSNDYGNTWSIPEKTKIWGFPPHMIKLHDGKILCMISHRRPLYSIQGCVSSDNGETWDTENTFTIYKWEDEPDMGYPVSIELSHGIILTVFYCSRRDAKTPNHPAPWTHLKQTADSPEGILSVKYRIIG
jgi:hypothetical protein